MNENDEEVISEPLNISEIHLIINESIFSNSQQKFLASPFLGYRQKKPIVTLEINLRKQILLLFEKCRVIVSTIAPVGDSTSSPV